MILFLPLFFVLTAYAWAQTPCPMPEAPCKPQADFTKIEPKLEDTIMLQDVGTTQFLSLRDQVLFDLASKNIQPIPGNNLLHNAVMTGNRDFVEEAINAYRFVHDQDCTLRHFVFAKNDQGQTPYELALAIKQEGIATYLNRTIKQLSL